MPRLSSSSDEDYSSTAQFLANPSSRSASSSPNLHRHSNAHQQQQRSQPQSPSLFSRPTQWSRSSNRSGLRAKASETFYNLRERADNLLHSLSPAQKIALSLALAILFILGILFLIFSHRIFAALAPLATKWRSSSTGWLILWLMIVAVSFPPLIGYSTCFTLAGFVFGVWRGYLIVATATVVGSTLSFMASRRFLKGYVKRLTERDQRFNALALTLKHDGLKLLVMIRLCPLPYSFSNGAISTIPTITPVQFAVATAVASPKLLVGVFIGSRLGDIAKGGEGMDWKGRVASYASIAVGVAVGVGTGWFMYTQTQKRAKELEEMERRGEQGSRGSRRRSAEEDVGGYVDEDERDVERGVADGQVRGDDGISLHTAGGEEEAEDRGYRDDFEDDGAADAASLDAVFQAGDGDDSEPESPEAYRDHENWKDTRQDS